MTAARATVGGMSLALGAWRRNRHGRAADHESPAHRPLNEDLAREYQAIIAYVVYSQVFKGADT